VTETPRSAAWPALWVVLMVMLAIPIPLRGIPMPERGVPILYLVVAGTVLILIHIARTSLPLALLLGYTLFWVLTSGFPVRGVQILVLMVLGALLYIEASRLTASWVRRVAWAFIVGSILQVVLGLINMLHVFPSPTTPALALRWIGVDPMPVFKFFDAGPWLSLMTTEFLGRPMGWLTHPNFWGSYVALAVPVVYVVRSEDLFGRRGACPAMIACGLLSAARTAGIEGLKSGWSVNILAVDEGVVDGEVERWAARLTEGGGPTGELVRLGGSHLGRLQP